MPHTVHADRGTSMTSKKVSQLLIDLGVTRNHSRPKVSNDNPFSEGQFRTTKYAPDYPERFDSLTHAREWMEAQLPRRLRSRGITPRIARREARGLTPVRTPPAGH
ncbi:hypothetical protein [Streptomyces sp. NPDC087437]|uniref:hypothetical protein n=1 Tax=Streptomyces sp. NPDC087437 TaxID=3365789 RepID=UPI00380EE406